jgi:hypothetical protein
LLLGRIDWETRGVQFAWFLLFALLTRASVFGDPHYTNGEAFYLLVGQRAHEGFLPYVDIWDRKGPGLFLTYYLISAISFAVVTYQIAALLAAATTAFIVNQIAERFSTRTGAMFAGTFYLALLPLYGGGGGQPNVRSTTQRRGNTLKPETSSDRRIISTVKSRRAAASSSLVRS